MFTCDIISCDATAALPQNKIGSGKLMGPKGVSVDRNGHVIVVDNKSCCVFIFQLNGKLVTKFGNRGNGDRQFAGRLVGTAYKHKYLLAFPFPMFHPNTLVI